MNSKRKGSSGERELAEILRNAGIRAQRNDQIFKGGKDNPDVSAEIADIKLHIEVKRVERLNVNEAMHQAMEDANPEALPAVAHRRNREKWLITLPLMRLLNVLAEKGIIRHEETEIHPDL